jgi:thioredoxin-like negative regulator of GroEL
VIRCLLSLLFPLAPAVAGEPEVNVTWKEAHALLLVRAPAGEHLAPDAPFDVEVTVGERSVVLATLGDDAAEGVPVGDVRGERVVGALRFSLCEDGGTRCRLLDVRVEGEVGTKKRGTAVLAASAARPVASAGFPARVDAATVLARATEDARARGLPVLLDFGAVWCPPCQLMDSELLLAPRRPAVVEAFVLARLDVDDRSSWPIKDRYEVRSYPTIVAIEADGDEIGRLVGYPGLDPMVAWLDDVATGRLVRRPTDPSPPEAAALAWQAVREERLDEARRLVAIGAAEPDRVELRLARFHVAPTVEDATWLAERARGRAIDWVGATASVADEPAGRAAILRAIEADVATAKPLVAADLLAVAADSAESDVERRTLYGAAAALVRGVLTGDPAQDKGHTHTLAVLTERAGRVDEAAELLRRACDRWPEEPTFFHDLARLELRHGHAEEALVAADRALELAWGDNRLTAARAKAEALVKLGRGAEARRFVDAVLAEQPEPGADMDVRARRYRDQLRDVVKDVPTGR